jgi:hypothetical protein
MLDAIAAGGGPYTFDCDGPTTITPTAAIVIDNDVILDGQGNLILDGRGVSVTEGVTATLNGVTIQGTRGAISNRGALTLTNVILTDNGPCCCQGCGISVVYSEGELTMTDSTVSNNTGGTAVIFSTGELTMTDSIVSDNTGSAAIILVTIGGDLTVTRTTIADNDHSDLVGNHSTLSSAGTTLIEESTVSGNSAGILASPPGAATVINSTFSDNEDFGIAGNITVVNSTIVGSNAVADRPDENEAPIVRGTVISGACEAGVVSGGYNIESPGNICGFDQEGDQVDVTEGQLNLGPLQDNGGPTMTHALGAGSVAIDVIPADMCDVDTDQRGVTRPQGAMCDVGAFEVEEE